MEDFDWIEFALIFEDRPTADELEGLLRSFPLLATQNINRGEVSTNWYGEDHTSTEDIGGAVKAAETLATRENCGLTCGFNGFELSISKNTRHSLLSSVPHLILRETVYPFKQPKSEERSDEIAGRRRSFSKTLADSAAILDPEWGFGRRGGLAIGEDQSPKTLASLTRPPLYEYNAFREETVDEIGRDRVLSAPAWYVEELDNGGAFIAIKEPPRSSGRSHEDYQAVADHLGLSLATPSRYH